MNACPHCRALARIEPGGALRWRCGVCGGPVVPTEGNVARSSAELPSLVAAQRLRAMAFGWTAAGWVFGVIAAMTLGLGALLWLASHLAAVIFLALGAAAAGLSLVSARQARRRGAEARSKLDEAWQLVAGEVVGAHPGELTAAELARAMHTGEDHAQALLAALSAGGRVRVAVRDDAELAYSPEEAEDAASTAAGPGAAGPAAAPTAPTAAARVPADREPPQ